MKNIKTSVSGETKTYDYPSVTTLTVSKEAQRALRVYAATHDLTMRDAANLAILDYVATNSK